MKNNIWKMIKLLIAIICLILVITSFLASSYTQKIQDEDFSKFVTMDEYNRHISKLNIAVIQVQQWLTDISATRAYLDSMMVFQKLQNIFSQEMKL